MRERWDEAINKIDEKYIAEAAETHAKHAEKQLEAEKFEQDERPTAIAAVPVKKSSKGKIIGICSAAAAVALMAVGGGVMLSRDDSILTGDTTTESTLEATAESTESSESIDYTEAADYIIDFARSYEEGYISFAAPEKSAWLGGNGVRGPVSDWERAGVLDYVLEISDIDISMMDKNLIDNGYILDLSDNKSYMNSLASAERQNRQITLVYTKGEAELLINIGESDDNFRYHFYGEAARLDAAGTGSYLRSFWTGENAVISISGMINADECSYYAVDISELEEDIFCTISARGCTTEDILDTLAGLVCDTEALTERAAEPLDLSQYGAFETSRYNVDLPLDEYRVDELKEAVFELEEPQPVYSIGSCETYSAKLKLYRSETVDGHYEYLQLHKKTGGSVDEFYYSISDTNNTAYFRISEDSYNNLYWWFATNGPAYFDGKVLAEDDIGNTTSPEDGRYLIERDGGAVLLHDDNLFAVGDTVRVWFGGLIMESYPAQVNKIKVEKIYAAAEDESPLVPEGEEIGGFDAAVYEEYFLGQWCTMDALEYTHTFDYNSGFVDHIACGELSDGYYFCCYNGGQPEFCFIPKECTDYMFAYGAVDLQAPQNSKRSDFYDEFYRRGQIGNSLSGALNMMGEAALIDRMGGNFADVLQSLRDGYTLNDTFWVFGQGYAGTPNDPKMYLKDYCQGTNAYYAEIYMQYYNADTVDQYSDGSDALLQWYSHFITLTDNGYEVVATLPCDKYGNVAPDAEGRSFTEDDLYGHDVTAVFSWAGTGDYIAYPQVYVEDTNTRRVLAQTHIQNPSMWSYGGYILQGFDVKVMDVRLNGGAVFAVMIPVSHNPGPDATGYEVTFYWYDKPNKELHLVGEADGGFFPICVNEGITTEPENNIVRIAWTSGGERSFRFDFTDDGVKVTDSEARDDVIYVDLSKGNAYGPDFSVWANVFAGKWENGTRTWELDLNSHDFGYNDPCRFYSDENGFFMLAENRAWYIPADDHDQMFYFEKVKQSGELSLSEFYGRYTRAEPFQGFSMGEGEMGWFGLLHLLYDSEGDGVTADQLLHLEITDENGNVWTRGGDKNIDWSGMYCAEIDGNSVIFLLMQSKDHPETFQYFSFDIDMDAAGEGVLKYSDEHYTFNMWITDTSVLSTDYATAIKTDVESSEHGKFTMRTMFYPMEDGSYYAIRMMGNDQAQWITDGELFYNSRDYDGVEGYEKLSDDIGISICMTDENVLYRLYNRYEDGMNTTLRLAAYSGGDQVCDIHVSNEGFLPMGGAEASIIGTSEKYLLIQYYDTTIQLDQYVLYDISDPASLDVKLRAVTCEYLADGSVSLTAEDGSVLNIN